MVTTGKQIFNLLKIAIDFLMGEVEEEVEEGKVLTLLENYFSGSAKDPDMEYEYGMTLLHCAVSAGFFKIVKYLVEVAGADPEKTDEYGDTPLRYASFYDSRHIGFFGSSKKSYMDVIKYLVEEAKADPNKANKHGETPLRTSILGNNTAVTDYLRSVGAKE